MRSIKSKILCIVIFALVATSLSIGAISYTLTHKIMHKNADAILNSMIVEKATQVNSVFQNIEYAVHLVDVFSVSSMTSAEQLRDPVFLNNYMQEAENLMTNVAQKTDGIIGYYVRLAPELTSATTGFFYNKNMTSGEFYEVPPTDLSLYESDDVEHVGWYYEVVRAGHAIWMAPYYNQNNNTRMISYVVPMYCENELIGIVGMDVAFDHLTDSVDNITVYENGFAYLVGNDNELVYCSRNLEKYSEKEIGDYLERSSDLYNGMKLIIRVGYRDVQQESYVLLFSIIVIDVILAAVFILVTVYCADRIIKPLKKLTKMARALVDGEKIPELASNSKDEVGMLSRIFVETSEKLQDNMSYITALAYRDSLTGVKNTAAYTEAIADMEKQMNCSRPQFGVLVADVNDLKRINDTYGHDAGNQMIIHASRLLGGTFRYSPLFRIGGDEFAVILTGRDFEKYRQRLKQLDDMSDQEVITIDGVDIRLSLARGVAVYNADIDRTFNDVFHHADHAMYMHKQTMKQANANNDM